MRNLIVSIVLFAVHQCYGQLITTNYSSSMINKNFIIEQHEQKDRGFKSRVYIIQFDTLVPRLELQFSSGKELEYFDNYIGCFLVECHRDKQPLILPNFTKLIYSKEKRGYCDPKTQTVMFKRNSLVQFARALKRINRKEKSRSGVNNGWQRYKVLF